MTGRELLRRLEKLGCEQIRRARFARDRPLPWRLPDRDPDPPREGPPDRNDAEHRAHACAMPRRRVASMTRTKSYVAVYDRDPESDAWLVHIKGIDGCQTYGRSLRQAEARIEKRSRSGSIVTPTASGSPQSGPQSSSMLRRRSRGPARPRPRLRRGWSNDPEGCEEARADGPQPSRCRRHPRHLPSTRAAAPRRVNRRRAGPLGHVGGTAGPTTFGERVESCIIPLTCAFKLERVTGIEPA